MKASQISSQAELETALGQSLFLLYKHSFRCGISGAAAQQYDLFVDGNPALATGWIDVVEQRELSTWFAEHTGLRHQSPQAVLFVDGEIVWSTTHHSITEENLKKAIDSKRAQ